MSSPHSNYKKAREYYIKHQSCSYHQLASTLFENFIHTSQNPENDIQNVLARNRLKKIKENRMRMHYIVTCIEFCGCQELPLRGHRDPGPFLPIASQYNEGVFRAALRLRLECSDKVTSDLFWNAPRNASYLSWKVQNDIISIMGSKIQKQIVSDASKNKFFSILADETSDLSQTEQLSISVRFVKKYTIHEEFLCFVPVSSITGENLMNVILLELRKLGLNLDHLRDQGYDGASNMSGKFSGVQARVKELYPLALYTHCCSHVLNLVISSASELRVISNALSTIGEVCTFLTRSAHQVQALREHIEEETPNANHQRLKLLCPTRWVERHDSTIIFLELFPAIAKTLEDHQDDVSQVSAKATTILNSIAKINFLVACCAIEKFSGLLLPLSKLLQKKELDIFLTNEVVESLQEALSNDREQSVASFKEVYRKVENL